MTGATAKRIAIQWYKNAIKINRITCEADLLRHEPESNVVQVLFENPGPPPERWIGDVRCWKDLEGMTL